MEGGIKLYLDDIRKCPVGWTLARTYDEAIKILKTGKVEEASLDHDLGEQHYIAAVEEALGQQDVKYEGKTGYDVVLWMEENNVWPPRGVHVHSYNPVGAARMRTVIGKHYGESKHK